MKLPFNILKDEVFCCSRQVLATKRKNLVKQGKGNRPNVTRELEDEEEEKLFESGELRYSVLSGGFCQCTLALEPETKAENSIGAT